MNTYLIIGAPGQGKSDYVKKFINGELDGQDRRLKRCFVFDIQNEYGRRTKYAGQIPLNLSDNLNDIRARYIKGDVEGFTATALTKRDTVIVLEEATIFFQGSQKRDTYKMLVNRYHTGNVYFFLFHSINRVPPGIMEMCNYVILYPTLDEPNNVARKFGTLFPYFMALKEQKEKKYFVIPMIGQ
jgi:hypothetical protein